MDQHCNPVVGNDWVSLFLKTGPEQAVSNDGGFARNGAKNVGYLRQTASVGHWPGTWKGVDLYLPAQFAQFGNDSGIVEISSGSLVRVPGA
jgi:hypothetical protein